MRRKFDLVFYHKNSHGLRLYHPVWRKARPQTNGGRIAQMRHFHHRRISRETLSKRKVKAD